MVNKIYPLPEVVDSGKNLFTIIENNFARVDMTKKEMYVPLDNSSSSKWLRDHEMGHVAISPVKISKKAKEIGFKYIQIAEDFRVNIFISRLLSNGFDAHEEPNILNEISRCEKPFIAVSFYVSTFMSPFFPYAQKKCQEILGNALFEVFEKQIERVLDSYDYYRRKIQVGRKSYPPSHKKHFETITFRIAEIIKQFEKVEKVEKEKTDEQKKEKGSSNAFGEMHLKYAPLTRVIRDSKITRKTYVFSDIGIIPSKMERMCTDQKVFSVRNRINKKHLYLVDSSGSIQWTMDEIDTLLSLVANPKAEIYLYGGEGPKGDLFLVSRNGMTVTTESLRNWKDHRYNSIDLPALEYCVKQAGTGNVTWISDQLVNGVEHRVFPENIIKCLMFCKSHGVRTIRLKDPRISSPITQVKEGLQI